MILGRQGTKPVILWLALLGLGGCSSSDDNDVVNWMAEQRNTIKPQVSKVNEPKKFDPAPYEVQTQLDPFNAQKLLSQLKADSAVSDAGSALLTRELNRRKENLELMPLDTMRMVGVIDGKSQKIALVRIDKLLYQVAVGAYLGQNFGKVLEITESNMKLREIVQDASGEWVERVTLLELQEGEK